MSDTWYSKDLGDGVEAFEPTSEMMKAFFLALAAAGSPTDMALFSCYDHHRNIVTAFFSPAASAIA